MLMRFSALCVSGFLLLSLNEAIAQNQITTPQIVVRASAQKVVRPDALSLTFGADARAENHLDAMNEVSRTVSRILEAAAEQGIPKADLQTSRINLQYIGGERKERFYAENLIHVTLKNPDKAGELIGRLIAAGANRIHSVRPIVDQSELLAKELRADAIKRAKQQATETAEAAEVRLARIMSISTDFSDGTRANYLMEYRRTEGQSVDVPLELGVVTVSATASIIWSIDQ